MENIDLKSTQMFNFRNNPTHLDGESLPLFGAGSVVLDVEEGLVALVDHQPDGVGQAVAGTARVPTGVDHVTLGLHLWVAVGGLGD